jgi:hypothetical protein
MKKIGKSLHDCIAVQKNDAAMQENDSRRVGHPIADTSLSN